MMPTRPHRLATAYDIFGLKRAKGQVQTFDGLTSAILWCARPYLSLLAAVSY